MVSVLCMLFLNLGIIVRTGVEIFWCKITSTLFNFFVSFSQSLQMQLVLNPVQYYYLFVCLFVVFINRTCVHLASNEILPFILYL